MAKSFRAPRPPRGERAPSPPSGGPSNQTRSYLMRRFKEVGIAPRGNLGQNFLIDLNLVRLLARSAEIDSRDVVLEVGTGVGSLTTIMAREAGCVITIELDRLLQQMATEALQNHDNVRMILADILENKNRLNGEVLQAINEELDARPGSRFKLAANLPYNVATPILSNLLLLDRPPCSMTVTIQKELADRIVARPGTKDYGSLAIWLQSQCDAEIVRIMPPTVFWPRPKVQSAIIHIVRNDEKRTRIRDLRFFHTFVRAMFFHRRKFLRSELLAAFKKQVTKPQVDEVLESLGLVGELRAEQLDVEMVLALCDKMQDMVGVVEASEMDE